MAFTTSIHFTNIHVGVLVLVIGGGIEGLAWAGFAVNHLDIAPRYASILFGITNTSATIPGILSPLLVGYITENKVCLCIYFLLSCLNIKPSFVGKNTLKLALKTTNVKTKISLEEIYLLFSENLLFARVNSHIFVFYRRKKNGV